MPAGARPRKARVTAALAVVACAIVYLIATAASQSTMYYLTVEEALARGEALEGRWMRITGEVPGDSLSYDPATLKLSFRVEHGGASLPAVYYGVKPDSLMDGSRVVLEGSMHREGYFQVERLLVQCVSKYEAADGDYGRYEGAPRIERINGEAYEAYESRVPGRR